MSRAHMQVVNPDKVEFSLTFTMQLEHWKALREQLRAAHSWPACDLATAIVEMVTALERREFWTPEEKEKP